MTMKLFSTFSGVGGFELALQNAIGIDNVDIVGYSEIDKFAIQTYEKHFSAKNYGDIIKIDISSLQQYDLLTGGFPCQDISLAGKQKLSGGRTVLVKYLLQMLEINQPKYFVFENVKGLLSKKFTTFRESIFERIEKAGYRFEYKILNTKKLGLPQNRERVYIVGVRNDIDLEIKYPEEEKLKIFLKDILEDDVDDKFYMTQKQYDNLGYESLKRIYDYIAPTLDTSQGGHRQPKILYNKFNFRKLTPTEYERLQGFPDGRTSTCSNTQRYKQMGNAITVLVAEKLFKKLF